jgi:3-hydroxyacyl-[acyl-carrier-protein] dehydratase
MEIAIEEILQLLPHRYPFLLLDRILDFTLNEKIVGLKNVTVNEPFFQGHFPGKPVMPGVLILEAMAQAGGILAYKSAPGLTGNRLIYFMAIDKVKFRKPVVPGDQLILDLVALRRGQRVWKMQGKAFVEKALVAEAELTAAIMDAQSTVTGEEV